MVMETALSLPAATKKEIEALIRAGYYSSKSDAVKDAFRTLKQLTGEILDHDCVKQPLDNQKKFKVYSDFSLQMTLVNQ